MKAIKEINEYSVLEEKINISSHAIGFILSIVALLLLVVHAKTYGNILHVISFRAPLLIASCHALRGFTASPDSALRFLDRPMLMTVGMASKARLDSELAVKPEGTSN